MNLEVLLKDLEGKSEAQLRNLYADALAAESDAKKALYVLRQRLANLTTYAEVEEERLLAEAKAAVSDGQKYLIALEEKIGVRPTTPTTN